MIDILLATYNGEKYIDTQISSIVNQTCREWKLYIHDDGSSDSTVKKIERWCEMDSRIEFIDDGVHFHNPGNHFMHLLKFSKSELVCFCDQDDLWLEYKLETMLTNFDSSAKRPLLLLSGCYLWNSVKKEIMPKIDFNKPECLEDFLFLNGGLQGCAMMFNAALRDVALSRNIQNLYMHDYLISLIAFSFGNVVYLNENLFLYRQYENNFSIHPVTDKSDYKKRVRRNSHIPVVYAPVYKNILSFYNSFEKELPDKAKTVLKNYLELKNKGKIERFFGILFSRFSLGKNGKGRLLLKIFLRSYWREDYE